MLFFILQIALIFFASFAARKPGLNMVALFSFTTVSGLTLGPLLYQVGPSIAAEAFALTAITFAGLSMYVVYSKKDFSFMSGFLMTGLIVLVVGGLLNMFFIQSGMMHFVMSGASVLLFSGFILYDTSNILRYYGTDEYVSATLALYLDVLNPVYYTQLTLPTTVSVYFCVVSVDSNKSSKDKICSPWSLHNTTQSPYHQVSLI